jgi:hypothetical protein
MSVPSDKSLWEAKFVDTFILTEKRSRYKTLLSNPRKRNKILDRLNHNADLDFKKATEVKPYVSTLMKALEGYVIDDYCWMISDHPDIDGRNLPTSEAIELTIDATWGTIMICPPKPIAVFREEAPLENLFLFI